MKGQKILKVTGILMIICGAVAAVAAVLGLIGTIAAIALEADTPLLIPAAALLILSAVFQLIAGIMGVKNCAKPEKAKACLAMGIIVAVLCILGSVLSVVGGNELNILSLVLGLVLPIIYIIGAILNKQ